MSALTRRACLGGAAALCAFPASAAGSAKRSFDILRGDDPIGTQATTVTLKGDMLSVSVEVRIQVKILGLTAYRYEMSHREDWVAGALSAMRSRTNDDGDADFVDAALSGDRLMITGSGYTGPAPAGAGTTTYWNRGFLNRKVWINTQTGAPLSISARALGGGRTAISGDIDLILSYDDRGEWIGSEFQSRGETVRFRLTGETGPLAPLWPWG